MNDIGAFLPADALQYISRNLHSAQPFATRRDAEAHLRHTHREWGDISDEQYRHLVAHGTRRERDGHRLHFDPQLETVARPLPFAPGIYLWDAWYRIHCPVLLLRGEESTVFPSHVARTMRDVKPAAQLVEFAACGHAPALMSREQIEVVRDFVIPEPRARAAVSPEARHERPQRFHTPRPA